MAKVFDELDERLRGFIERQHMFFVATAPRADDAHVNVSPKGLDTFAVLDPHTVAYLDLTGSGVETIAHLRENGRITIMFCAFEGPPKILRLYGGGEVLEPDHPDFDELRACFPTQVGVRSVIRISVTRIADSCGYAVPKLSYADDRDVLTKWTLKKGEPALAAYRETCNGESIDGLPGLASAAARPDVLA